MIDRGDLMLSVTRVCATGLLFVGLATFAAAQQVPKEVTDKIDAVVAMAYQAAAAKFPCKVSTQPRYPMLRWQNVDKCLDQAQNRVDWDAFIERIKAVRPPYVPEGDFIVAVEKSLNKQALPFDKVFLVRSKNAFLPLTNSILKYLPPNALADQPVYEQKGKQQVGTFLGIFFYEHAGGLASANPYRLAQFQYKDLQGNSQVPLSGSSDRILYDSFGVPWNKITSQLGFRLTHKKLLDYGIK
jgi:hypothetical protein